MDGKAAVTAGTEHFDRAARPQYFEGTTAFLALHNQLNNDSRVNNALSG